MPDEIRPAETLAKLKKADAAFTAAQAGIDRVLKDLQKAIAVAENAKKNLGTEAD